MYSKYKELLILPLLLLSLSLLTISPISLLNEQVLAQGSNDDSGLFKINVHVLNSGNTNLVGSIHVMSTSTGASLNANDITFIPGQTVIKIFEFNQSQIPMGTEFSVEVVYGDDYSVRAYGVNNQSYNMPEFFNITIP